MKLSQRSSSVDVRQLSRCLRHFDVYKNCCISVAEFEQALREVAIIYRPNEIQVLANYYSSGDPGMINYEAF